MAFLDELIKKVASGVHKVIKPEEKVKNPIYKMQDFTSPTAQSSAQLKRPENVDTMIRDVGRNVTKVGEQAFSNVMPLIDTGVKKVSNAVNQSVLPKINETVRGIKPAGTFTLGQAADFGTSVLRAPGRATASLLLEGMNQGEIKPSTPAEKFVFGDEPVKSISQQSRETKDFAGKYGIKGPAVDYGVPLAIGALTVADLIPTGLDDLLAQGGKKVAQQTAVKFLGGLDEIAKTAGSTDELIKGIDDAVRVAVTASEGKQEVLQGVRQALEKKVTTVADDAVKAVLTDHMGILDDLLNTGEKALPKVAQAADELPLVSPSRTPNINTSAGGTDLPSAVRASNPLPSVVSDTVTTSPSSTYLPTASVDDILKSPSFQSKYKATTAEKPFLESLLSDVAGDREFKAATKDINTTAQKIVRKLSSKPEYSEEAIGDMLRGNIIARDSSDAKSIVSMLEQKVKIEGVENYIDRPTVWGYQGVNINIRTPNGNLAEVQIHTPESIKVQEALHGLYEKWRNEKVIPKEVFEESKRIADKARQEFRKTDSLPLIKDSPLPGGAGDASSSLPAGASQPPVPPEGGAITPNIVIDESGKLRKLDKPNKYEFDLKNLNTPDDVKNTILEMARSSNPEIQSGRRGTITWEQTRKFADALGMTTEEVINKKPGKMYNAEELDAATRLLLGAAEELTNVQQKVKALREAGQEVPEQLKSEMLQKTLQLKGLQSSVIGARSEAGRTLNAVKMLKDALTETDKTKAERVIKKIFAGDEKTAGEMIDRLGQFDSEDTLGMMKFIQSVKPTTPMDKIEEYWYNSVLSNTATHIVNFTSNTMSTLLRIPEKTVSSMIDSVLTTGGKAIGKTVQRDRYLAEVAGEVSGIRSGFTKGIQKALYVMKNGISASDVNKFDVARGQVLKGPVGNLINTPSRMLVASDELFKGVNYEMSLWAEAVRLAKQEGKTGGEFTARVADVVATPDPKIVEKAMEQAKYQLFQAPSQSANAVRAFRDNLAVLDMGKLGEFKPVRFIIPFIQTPVNVVKFGLERSPAGFIGAGVSALQGVEKGVVSDQLARAFIGSTMMVPLAMYFSEDKITGAPPNNAKEKDAFYADGKLPYSIKIGDRWVAYNRVEPFNTILTQIAMWHDSFKNNDELVSQESVTEFLRGTVMNLANQTFMTGLGNLINAVEDPKRYGQKFMTDIAGGFIPSLVAAGARTLDPTIRDPQNPVQDLQARLPLLSRDLPARESEFEPGGEAVRKGGLLTQLINNFIGFRSSPAGSEDILGKVQEIQQMNKQAKAISEEEKQDALKMFEQIQKTPPEDRQQLLTGWIEEGKLDDKAVTVITNAIKERALPLKGEESYLKNSPVKTRAQYIYKEIQKIKPEDRQAYFDRLVESKILTDDVVDAFIELTGSGSASQDLPIMAR